MFVCSFFSNLPMRAANKHLIVHVPDQLCPDPRPVRAQGLGAAFLSGLARASDPN